MLRRRRSPSADRLSVTEATSAFQRIVKDSGVGVAAMSAEVAFGNYATFASVRFATPGTPDSDGLLYQFGTYKFSGEERFHLDLVRQFEVLDGDEHDHYVQFHCELTFDPAPELMALGRFSDWYFYGPNAPLPSVWLSSIRQRPEWRALAGFNPTNVRIFQEVSDGRPE
jgi:hypothetical protein